jgi:phospholipid transport system substrate-binding protein
VRLIRFLAFFVLLAAPPALAQNDPAAFVMNLGQQTLDVINRKPAPAERDNAFRSILHQGFDMQSLARFVLGPHWRSASDAQKQEFTKLFEDYIVTAYGSRFAEYTGEQFKVTGQRPEGESATLVQSQIVRPAGGAPIRVDWRVGRTQQGLRITDVVVEGISLIVTQRQEFSAVIQRNGGQLDALLKLLRDKVRA